MTIETRPGRPPAAPQTAAPAPLVVPPSGPTRGRIRSGAPLRREGPAKLTGQAKYADDLVFPGAWYGATIRSTEPHARFLELELDPGFDWSKVAVVTAADIPGDNVVEPRSATTSRSSSRSAARSSTRRSRSPCSPRRTARRSARPGARVRAGPSRCRRSSTRSTRDHVFAHYEIAKGDVDAGSPTPT